MALAELAQEVQRPRSEQESAASSFKVFYRVAAIKAQTMVRLGQESAHHLIYSPATPSNKVSARARAWLGREFETELKEVAEIFKRYGYPVCRLQNNAKDVFVFVSKK